MPEQVLPDGPYRFPREYKDRGWDIRKEEQAAFPPVKHCGFALS
jgi:hypothetical protein